MALRSRGLVPLMLACASLAVPAGAHASTAPIQRIAGTGTSSLYLDATPVTLGRPARETPFRSADRVAADGAGVIFSDKLDNRVLELPGDGSLRLFAGSGNTATSNGTNRWNANIPTPTGVAANGINGYLVTDEGTGGTSLRGISTLSDAMESSTTLAAPANDIWALPMSNFVYVALANGTIHRKQFGGGMTHVAGGGPTSGTFESGDPLTGDIGNPSDVSSRAADEEELFLVSSSDMNRVWLLDIVAPKAATPLTGAGGSLGDGGLASAAALSNPRSVLWLADGSYLIYDAGHRRIRRVSSTNLISATITTIAGNGTDGLAPDGTPANLAPLAADGDLAVTSQGLVITQGTKAAVMLIPASAITAGPPAFTSSRSASFTLASWDDSATFTCKLDGADEFSTCSSPPGLADGEHTYVARAATDGGTRFTDSATYRWTVDGTPPSAPLPAAPGAGAVVPPQPELTWEPATDATSGVDHYDVLVDDVKVGEAACCSFTPGAPLRDGAHTWQVRAVDKAGNGAALEPRSFTVSAPPTASLVVAPTRTLVNRAVTFDASKSADANGSIVRFEWDLDGNGSYETDTGSESRASRSYATPATLTPGLRVTDSDGLTGTAAALLTITVAPPAGDQLGVSINDGARYTNDPAVVVFAVWPAFASNALISNDGGFGASQSFPVAARTNWRLDSSGPERLPKTIYVRFTGGGSVSETYQDDIILDETPPKVLAATVAGAPAAARAGAAAARQLRIRARDNVSGVQWMQVTKSKRRPGKARKFKARVAVPGRGAVHVRVRDKAGNWSRWRTAR